MCHSSDENEKRSEKVFRKQIKLQFVLSNSATSCTNLKPFFLQSINLSSILNILAKNEFFFACKM